MALWDKNSRGMEASFWATLARKGFCFVLGSEMKCNVAHSVAEKTRRRGRGEVGRGGGGGMGALGKGLAELEGTCYC